MSNRPPKAVIYRQYEVQEEACEQALKFLLQKRAVPQPPLMPERRSMDRANQLYANSSECIVVLFDLRLPGTTERLHRERAAWREHSDIETLDENHFVLIVRPGGARRLTR